MANVIKTVMTYPLNGSTRDFNIPFEYLARKFVQVTLLGVDRKVLALNTDYRFSTKTTITTTQAWGAAQGYTQIEIRRYTSATERLVDFTDGSILRAYDLNVSQIQTMHVAEEARDLTADTIGVNNEGHLDARGRRIVNVANAVDDRDAVPLGQLKTMNQNAWDAQNKALQYRNEAQTFRNQAETFKNQAAASQTAAANSQAAAKTSETNAASSASNANAHRNAAAASQTAAKTSETNAATSASSAKTQADRATTEADRAKAEADKLSNWNALAGAVGAVSGNDVRWKGVQTSEKLFRSTSSAGGQSYANQLNAEAPFASLLPGKQDASMFYPVIKQYSERTSGKKMALSFGTTTQAADEYPFGTIHAITDTGRSVSWAFYSNGDFGVAQGGISAKGGIATSQPHASFTANVPNATDPTYILGKAGGANSWYVGKGGADDNIFLNSYKHGTFVRLEASAVVTNKPLKVAGSATIDGTGNITGTTWGDNLKNWINTYFKKKTKGWTVVRNGNVGGGVSVALSQDVRFRQCWVKINDHWMPVMIGPDTNYYVAGWGNGWIKFKISNNGKTFTNIQDSGTIPQAIAVENE